MGRQCFYKQAAFIACPASIISNSEAVLWKRFLLNALWTETQVSDSRMYTPVKSSAAVKQLPLRLWKINVSLQEATSTPSLQQSKQAELFNTDLLPLATPECDAVQFRGNRVPLCRLYWAHTGSSLGKVVVTHTDVVIEKSHLQLDQQTCQLTWF